MRKMPILVVAVVALVALGSLTLALHAQNRAAIGGPPAAAGDDMPHRTAKAFAPFIRAIASRRYNTAQQIFKLRRSVQTSLEDAETTGILARFIKPDRFDLNLIGGRTLGQNIGILLFTMASEDGPVAFKIYYYGFGNDIYVSRIEVTDDWDQIEAYSATVDAFPAPVSISHGAAAE
jgi:hypothetical protein